MPTGDDWLEARIADFAARNEFVQQYVDALKEHWHKHPEKAPRPSRPAVVYHDDDEAYADELGLTVRDYANTQR